MITMINPFIVMIGEPRRPSTKGNRCDGDAKTHNKAWTNSWKVAPLMPTFGGHRAEASLDAALTPRNRWGVPAEHDRILVSWEA